MRIEKSYGRAKYGRIVYFVRPDAECFNRSYRLICSSQEEFEKKFARISNKLEPEIIFMISGCKIVANSRENALKEYWRVCERGDIGKDFEVMEEPAR